MGIDNHINIIWEKGKQAFLVSSSDNFTRILHDYADKSKEFVLWKTALEEKLILFITKVEFSYNLISCKT